MTRNREHRTSGGLFLRFTHSPLILARSLISLTRSLHHIVKQLYGEHPEPQAKVNCWSFLLLLFVSIIIHYIIDSGGGVISPRTPSPQPTLPST